MVGAMKSDGHSVETVLAFGETLVDQFRDRNVLGGAPFNVACHLAALGAHPVLVTRAGKDALGDELMQTMVERGLDLRGVQSDPSRPTGRVRVTETESGHVFDILTDQAYDHIHAGMARMAAMSAHPNLVYFGTLAQRSESQRALRDILTAVETCAFLDVNLRDPWVEPEVLLWSLQQAAVVKLNEDELTRICTLFSLGSLDPENSAAALLSSFDLQRIVITRGQAGAWTLDRAGRIVEVASQPVANLVDTVGAGDGFASIVMLGMLRDWSVEMQMARADAFARAICGIRGAVPAAPDFYAPFLRDWELDRGAGRA
ncbi:MAG: carbohydrate kinase [Thiobacillus sp.]|nr:carbohydrate kinase [Thiobacillus sp.]